MTYVSVRFEDCQTDRNHRVFIIVEMTTGFTLNLPQFLEKADAINF